MNKPPLTTASRMPSIKVLEIMLKATLAFMFVRLVFVIFLQRFNTDEFLFLHNVWCLRHGLWPYRDFIDLHPPLLYLCYLPSFLAPEGPAVLFCARLLSLVYFLILNIILYRIIQIHRSDLGRVPGLFVLVIFNSALICGSKWVEIRPSTPASLFFLLAFFIYLNWRESPGRKLSTLFWIGMLMFLSSMGGLMTLPVIAGIYMHLMVSTVRGSRITVFLRTLVIAAAPMVIGWALLLCAYFAWAIPFQKFGHYPPLTYYAGWVLPGFCRQQKVETIIWTLKGDFLAWITSAICLVICLKHFPKNHGVFILVFPAFFMVFSLLVSPIFFLQQVALLLMLFVIPIGWALCVRFTPRLIVAAALVGVLSTGLVAYQYSIFGYQHSVFGSNQYQVERMNYLMEHTAPSDPVLDGWSGYGVFRPHVGPVFWYPCNLLNEQARENAFKYYALKAVAENRFGAIVYDEQLQCFGDRLKELIDRDYAPSKEYESIYLPKAAKTVEGN
jgi:hypothetical protein